MVRYITPKGVLVQEVLSETVLLDTERGLYFELNSMGAEMYRALAAGSDPAQLLGRLRLTYEVDEDALRRDLDALISQLEAEGLLSRAS